MVGISYGSKNIHAERIFEKEIVNFLGKEDNLVVSGLFEEEIDGKKVVSKSYLVFKKADIKNNAVIPIDFIEFIE